MRKASGRGGAAARHGLKARQAFGKYRIRRRLAQGGFATVYEAFDTIEGIPVAIKVLHPHLVDTHLVEAFRKEARVMARLDHPNVLPIKNAQFIDGQFAIVYPRGEGTLGDRMQRRLASATRVELARQMLDAVAYAHAHRVIHCDLKPENFILFPGPKLRLTDFGIARLAQRTVLGSGSGTVGYVAPEQALGRTSFRSDVFSLGLILYQLFSGELPEWPYEWPPPGIERLRRTCHPAFLAFLRRAIRVDQERRFANAIQMRDGFEELRRRGRVLAPARPPRRRRRRAPAPQRDWRLLRRRQFERLYRKPLGLTDVCSRCHGPISEIMFACPWCGTRRAVWRGETRRPEACPRCKRGRNPDWRYCAWCYGPAFRRVSSRPVRDPTLTERCGNPRCTRKLVAPYMRYCPWCRRKLRKRWNVPGAHHRCGRCGWAVLREYWNFCPWCGKGQGKS